MAPLTCTVTRFGVSILAPFANGVESTASFSYPAGLSVAPGGSGLLYIADHGNHRIRTATQAGIVATLAGSGSSTWADGQGTLAAFYFPRSLVANASGFVAGTDTYNNRVRLISPPGAVSTLVGGGSPQGKRI